jgi:hypothetical protein
MKPVGFAHCMVQISLLVREFLIAEYPTVKHELPTFLVVRQWSQLRYHAFFARRGLFLQANFCIVVLQGAVKVNLGLISED